ncbi:endolytic transglycosylase MltG [Blastococcus montanus]|uniref:endolytic transglycosylase MltG n=1 Tax=Blastococcus montanus TaxID=3144973 RepID=UPI00320A2B74
MFPSFPTAPGTSVGGFPPGGAQSSQRGFDRGADEHGFGRQHPSAPLPPLPRGVWDRLHPREDADDEATVAAPRLGRLPDEPAPGEPQPDDTPTSAHAYEDETGGLDVIGANVDDDAPRRRGLLRGRRAAGPPPQDTGAGGHPGDAVERGQAQDAPHDATDHHPVDAEHAAGATAADDEIPVVPYDPRAERSRRRRRRRPFAVALALLVLGGMVAGIVIGGQQLLSMVNPAAQDYTGSGTGSVDIRVQQGDTLSDIARTLEEADVVASTGPFIDAASANPAATGIQPGVYTMRQQMSGEAALELLLDPVSRQVARVTVPEGFTVEQILARLAEETGTPLEELQAAADPAALTLPPYANGQLEGFLFPATYDFEPDTTPQQMLQRMIDTFVDVAARLRLEERAAALGLSPYEVVTVASMVQSETRLDEERPDVAQVIYNRLEQGIALGIDATLAYGLDKSGNELTVSDLQTDSPYNTRTRQGLPPTPISSPGEASLEAALAPSSGDLLYYVLESEDGSHFFTSDYSEFQAARQRCAEADLGCGG